MTQHNEELIKFAVIKSKKALQDAQDCVKDDKLETALNRAYYSIFYSVTALAKKYNFSTSKHSALMGWFNKKFIYENKMFDKKMYQTYEEVFLYRQKSDYDLMYTPTKQEVENIIAKTGDFVDNVFKII